MESKSIRALLDENEGVNELNIAEPMAGVFEYTQHLLDEEENLTKIGNLTTSAKDLLRQRILECFGVQEEEHKPEGEGTDD